MSGSHPELGYDRYRWELTVREVVMAETHRER
jgi:hypothetical protein